jgi:hypothetical protein
MNSGPGCTKCPKKGEYRFSHSFGAGYALDFHHRSGHNADGSAARIGEEDTGKGVIFLKVFTSHQWQTYCYGT